MSRFSVIALSIVIGLLSATNGIAATACDPWVTKVVSAQGRVEAKRRTQTQWVHVKLNDTYCAGDSIQLGQHSRAGLLLRNQTVLRLDQGTTIVLPEIEEEKPIWLELIRGAAHLISNIPYRLKVKTPFVNAAIEGTEFAMRIKEKASHIWVFEGNVVAENMHGRLSLANSDAAVAEAGKAPVTMITVRPRDAVQWALYYPPIIDYRPEVTTNPIIQQAINLYRAGQIAQAIAIIEKVPDKHRDSRYFNLRAALLLSVGRVEQARNDIDQGHILEPDNGTALALLSIIALAQNDKEKAMDLARVAADMDPRSPTLQIALSYAYQAAFDIEKARDSIKKALALSPDDPLAWARFSELELSLGELDNALEAAKKAAALDSELPRTQMVLGFAYLTQIDLDQATVAFKRAIELDPAAPLPRLGLGLVKIRRGDVEEGAREIEVAAILDPDNSLVRSYLGKAYYEEKREGVASREFAIAKELDPKDPTPWFYAAIRKQTENRPVEALHDMQKAKELNDNRAVYRSRLLLDDDLAARSASLGRIYNDLGFQQLGLVAGWRSVNTDPSNYSAHRLLADNYAALPRHEIARVSELLQSQLLQPINITPVQPNLAERNLLILEGSGPSNASFNEFNPLFTRNRLTLQASGVFASNDTLGDEVTHSGVWNKFSYSLGQYHLETDGFRENNDLEQDVYNVFAQASLSPKLSVQTEFRHSDIEHGDLNLGLGQPNRIFRRNKHTNTFRIGGHYALAPHSDFISSIIYQNEKEKQEFAPGITSKVDSEGYIAELQYTYHVPRFDIIMGNGYYEVDNDITSFDEYVTRHKNGYVYSHIRFPNQVTWLVGVSYDSLDNGPFGKFRQTNPKLGIIWDVTSNTTLRLAAFRTLKRALLTDQTIEPTQVAGFNQFFDDLNGTESKRYGIALDQKFMSNLYGGLEASKRELKIPVFRGRPPTQDWEEKLYRAYLNWTPDPRVALSVTYELEDFEAEGGTNNNTHLVTGGLKYFHPYGLFSNLGITYVNQDVDTMSDDQFVLLDAGIGYRLPRRNGIIMLGVKNLLDKDFNFQGLGFRTRQEEGPPFIPDRTISAQITLSF